MLLTPFLWLGGLGVYHEDVPLNKAATVYYMRHRYYDAAQRRFISPDPTSFSDLVTREELLNLFVYARDNPLWYYDPAGLCAEAPWYRRVARLWSDLVDPAQGYWNLQANIPIASPVGIGPSVAVLATGEGLMVGLGFYAGIPGASFTRGPLQQPAPDSYSMSVQLEYGAAVELGNTYRRPTAEQKMEGRVFGVRTGSFGEIGAGTPGASLNIMYYTLSPWY